MKKTTLVTPEKIETAINTFDMVECVPQSLRLTRSSCIKNWQMAKASKAGNVEDYRGMYRARTMSMLQNSLCVDCHVGEARHKGEPDPSWYCICGAIKIRGECVRDGYQRLSEKGKKLKEKESKAPPHGRQKKLIVCERCGRRFMTRSASLCPSCVKHKIREKRIAEVLENPEEKRCTNCGKMFLMTNYKKRYCSPKCRNAVYEYNRREREKNGAPNLRENRPSIPSGNRRTDGDMSDGQGS